MFSVWGQADSLFGVKMTVKLARQSPSHYACQSTVIANWGRPLHFTWQFTALVNWWWPLRLLRFFLKWGRKVRAAQSKMTANGRTLKAGNSIRRGIGPQRRAYLVTVKRGNLHLQQDQIGQCAMKIARRGSRHWRVGCSSARVIVRLDEWLSALAIRPTKPGLSASFTFNLWRVNNATCRIYSTDKL